MKKLLILLLSTLLAFTARSQQMNCLNNLNISFSENCTTVLSADIFLQNFSGNVDDYTVNLITNQWQLIGNIADWSMSDDTWIVQVMHVNGNMCQSTNVTFSDGIAPTITCSPPETVDCTVDLTNFSLPLAQDNCDPNPIVSLIGQQYLDNVMCDDETMILKRTFIAIDHVGKKSAPCSQLVYIKKTAYSFPEDITWTCAQYAAYPNILDTTVLHISIVDTDDDLAGDIDVAANTSETILSQTGSGQPTGYKGVYCNYNVEYTDQVFSHCGTGTLKIHRKWIITDMCTGQIETHTQLIIVADNQGPQFDFSNIGAFEIIDGVMTLTVSTDLNNCSSTAFIPMPGLLDDCSGVKEFSITTPMGAVINKTLQGGFIPAPGIKVGVYSEALIYQAEDNCGNYTEEKITLIVADKVAPTMVCDEHTSVTLSNGIATMEALTIDDGSNDACGIYSFKIRRVDGNCNIVGNNSFDSVDDNGDGEVEEGDMPLGSNDPDEGSFIQFCCEDVAASPVKVILRAYDVYGNYNDCEVEVIVKDKVNPVCIAPANIAVDCHLLDMDLPYGEILTGSYDNCGIVETDSVVMVDLDECESGTITRTWTIADAAGNKSSCTQVITVNYSLGFKIKFPNDEMVDASFDIINPVILGNGNPCGNFYWSVEDEEIFDQNCNMKILRTFKSYTCKSNPDNYNPTVVDNLEAINEGGMVMADEINKGEFVYTQILVGENPNKIIASIANPETITCTNPIVTLNGSYTNGSANTTFEWQTSEGHFVSGISELSAKVDKPGTYTFKVFDTANGCEDNATVEVLINIEIPNVVLASVPPVCIDADAFELNSGSPTGGIYSIDGVVGTTFDPAELGAGLHTVKYTLVNNVNGCSNTASIEIVVNALPIVDAGSYGPVCVDGEDVLLKGKPTNGVFYAENIDLVNNTFQPSEVGTFTIFYAVSDLTTGCRATASTDIIVNALPKVEAGTYGPVCVDGANITLVGKPIGGTFSGSGVNGMNFEPATTGEGTYTITYTYTDGNGCENSTTTDIIVNALPIVDAGTYGPVCIDGANITLSGTPVGGTFSGTGVNGMNFEPATAGVGTYTITYTYTSGSGCENSTTTDIVVSALPIVTAGTYGPVCVDGANITLSGTPVGGTFSGVGVNGLSFEPAIAGVGTYTITYSYTDGNGCENSTTTDIVVSALPIVDAGTYGPVCIDGTNITLAGTPVGGTFSGTGVNGLSFELVTAGGGTHTITYSYTDGNGCTNTSTTDIVVNALPKVEAGTYGPVCIDGGPIELQGMPVGGTFTGKGVIGNSFDPITAGVGEHIITYNFTDDNGCRNSSSTTIVVNKTPKVSAGEYEPVCINNTITLFGTPTEGTFSGPGVMNNIFNPASVGIGTYTITYAYTDGNSCSDEVTTDITVNNLPALAVSSNSPICKGFDIELKETGGVAQSWSWTGPNDYTSSDHNPTIDNTNSNASGTYTVKVTDTNGCENQTSIDVVVNATPIVTVSSNSPICNGFDIELKETGGAAQSWAWNGPNGFNSTFQNPILESVGSEATGTYTVTITDANGCKNQTSIDVVVNATPVVTVSSNSPICNGFNMELKETGGAAQSWVWSGPNAFSAVVSNPIITSAAPLNSGLYYVLVKDINGCENVASVDVTVNPSPIVSLGSYGPVCLDALPIILSGEPVDGTYEVDGVVQSSSFNPASAGTYNVVYSYTDGNGCLNTATTIILVNALPTVDAGQDGIITCANPTFTLGSDPVQGYTYKWTGDGITQVDEVLANPLVTDAGTYNLNVVNEAGCISNDEVVVAVDTLQPIVLLSMDTIVCGLDMDNPYTISSEGSSSGVDYSYQWILENAVQGTGEELSVSSPGEYLLKIMNTINGCEMTDTILVEDDYVPPYVECDQELMFCDTNLNSTSCFIDSIVIDLITTDNRPWAGTFEYELQLDTDGNGEYDETILSTDDGAPGIKIEIDGNEFHLSIVVYGVHYGTHQISWVIKDDCGNETLCTTMIVVEDCVTPKATCLSDIIINITPPDNKATVYAEDLLNSYSDNCTIDENLVVGFKEGFFGPLVSSIAFGCEYVGVLGIIVSPLVKDEYGKYAGCETKVTVVAPDNLCTGQSPSFAIIQNTPNPFSDQTTIEFTIPSPQNIDLFIYDAHGRAVVNKRAFFNAGLNKFKISNEAFLTSGVYYYQIQGNIEISKVEKMTFVRE